MAEHSMCQAGPRWFPRLARLPEGKVHGVSFAGVDGDAGSGHHLIQASFGKLAVVGKGIHGEIDVASRRIGMPRPDELLDQFDHLGDELGSPRFMGGPLHAKPIHVLVKGLDVTLGNCLGVGALFLGPLDDLVVHIGEVSDEHHLVATVSQVPVDRVENKGRAGMTYMADVVGGDAANVHVDLSGPERSEDLLLIRKGVVDPELIHACHLVYLYR
jgi:hypothetical protein